ncbi:hypothetical protein B0T19DRAFT_401809 [Cercophora scortea]|uniref:Uncharacterized protein n=1 Tax=Cercophora scortea TaxID=314031 RepID=A0AAE0IE73_9PEZI|nr:hypothetical protein B0T19DRAFT_401809 [Cercophora scortea]
MTATRAAAAAATGLRYRAQCQSASTPCRREAERDIPPPLSRKGCWSVFTLDMPYQTQPITKNQNRDQNRIQDWNQNQNQNANPSPNQTQKSSSHLVLRTLHLAPCTLHLALHHDARSDASVRLKHVKPALPGSANATLLIRYPTGVVFGNCTNLV